MKTTQLSPRAHTPSRPERRLIPKMRIVLARIPLFRFLGLLRPGVVAAIAGDDAGGIATYATVGAQYGYELLWSIVVITIFLAVIQEMVARLSVVTGKGLSDLIREEFGVHTSAIAMLVLFVATGAVTISEFVGIAAAGELFGVPRYLSVPMAAVVIWWLIAYGDYHLAELANSHRLLGDRANGRVANVIAGATTVIMIGLTVMLFGSTFFGIQ